MRARVIISTIMAVLLVLPALIYGRASSEAVEAKVVLQLYPYVPVEMHGVRKCPVCGFNVPDAKVKEPEGAQVLHELITKRLLATESCKFIVQDDYRDAGYYDVSDEADRIEIRELAAEKGSDAVLYPVLLRYRERVGNQFAASMPAAVAFHIYILDVEEFGMLWRGAYSEEQAPLSNNLLGFMQAYRRGFKWVKADRLIEDGLNRVFKSFPGCEALER